MSNFAGTQKTCAIRDCTRVTTRHSLKAAVYELTKIRHVPKNARFYHNFFIVDLDYFKSSVNCLLLVSQSIN